MFGILLNKEIFLYKRPYCICVLQMDESNDVCGERKQRFKFGPEDDKPINSFN